MSTSVCAWHVADGDANGPMKQGTNYEFKSQGELKSQISAHLPGCLLTFVSPALPRHFNSSYKATCKPTLVYKSAASGIGPLEVYEAIESIGTFDG